MGASALNLLDHCLHGGHQTQRRRLVARAMAPPPFVIVVARRIRPSSRTLVNVDGSCALSVVGLGGASTSVGRVTDRVAYNFEQF